MLDRLIPAIRPGGLLLLRIPDRDSVYGFATRHSPYWPRFRTNDASKPQSGQAQQAAGPFPLVYDKVVSWRRMTAYG